MKGRGRTTGSRALSCSASRAWLVSLIQGAWAERLDAALSLEAASQRPWHAEPARAQSLPRSSFPMGEDERLSRPLRIAWKPGGSLVEGIRMSPLLSGRGTGMSLLLQDEEAGTTPLRYPGHSWPVWESIQGKGRCPLGQPAEGTGMSPILQLRTAWKSRGSLVGSGARQHPHQTALPGVSAACPGRP